MSTILFYRDGQSVDPAEVRAELNASAVDAGVPIEMAGALLFDACLGDACACEMIENLMPGLECITEVGFGDKTSC